MDHTAARERNMGLPIVLMSVGLLCIIVFLGFASFKNRRSVNVRARILPAVASGSVTAHPSVVVAAKAQPPEAKPAVTNSPALAASKATDALEKPDGKSAQPGTVSATEKPLKLQSIVYSQRPFAMISGAIVAKGETIRNYKVTNIEAEKVTLSGDEGTIILTLE
jgi:hypothetical protein